MRERLGDYVAPAGLYDQNKGKPFVGKVTCNVDRLVAGQWTEIVLDYEIGASGVADGAWFKATFKFYSDWALFQTVDPTRANYVSAEYQAGPLRAGQSPATVQSLKVRFDQKGHERPFQKAIIVDTVDGYLNAGDHIIIRLGDRRAGGPGTRVQTFVEDKFRFRCYVDPLGTSRFVAVPGDVVIDIVSRTDREPFADWTAAGASGRAVQAASVRARSLGQCVQRAGGNGGSRRATRRQAGLPQDRQIGAQGWADYGGHRFAGREQASSRSSAEMPGRSRVRAAVHYVTLDANAPCPRIFYGDLHVHSHDTVGTNSPDYNTRYGRDIAGLDVMAYTANDFQITDAQLGAWREVDARAARDGEFVCYPVQEWCGSSTAGGDHNVVFLGDEQARLSLQREGRAQPHVHVERGHERHRRSISAAGRSRSCGSPTSTMPNII